MDFMKLRKLPMILPPRREKLRNVKRSQEELTQPEIEFAQAQLEKMYPARKPIIEKQDLKIILLRLNLKITDSTIEEYIQNQSTWEEKTEFSFEDFFVLYREILSNQTPFFRMMYVQEQPFQLSDICQHNLEDAKRVFAIYDEFHCGSIPAEVLTEVFTDMGFSFVSDPFHTLYFSKLIDAANEISGGYVNFEDFIRIHNGLIDQLLHSYQ